MLGRKTNNQKTCQIPTLFRIKLVPEFVGEIKSRRKCYKTPDFRNTEKELLKVRKTKNTEKYPYYGNTEFYSTDARAQSNHKRNPEKTRFLEPNVLFVIERA